MVDTSELGKTVDNTWLEITPPLPGKLLWKAQNIAQLVPDTSPRDRRQLYIFDSRKNAAISTSRPSRPGVFATLAAEPFRIMAANPPNRWSSDYVPSTGAWVLAFNDAVDPAAAAAFISFAFEIGRRGWRPNLSARRSPAPVTSHPPTGHGPRGFAGAPTTVTAPETPVPNILIARPVTPLPPGEGWTVSILKGLPNLTGNARLLEDASYDIGKIEPFRIAAIHPEVDPDVPRQDLLRIQSGLPKTCPRIF